MLLYRNNHADMNMVVCIQFPITDPNTNRGRLNLSLCWGIRLLVNSVQKKVETIADIIREIANPPNKENTIPYSTNCLLESRFHCKVLNMYLNIKTARVNSGNQNKSANRSTGTKLWNGIVMTICVATRKNINNPWSNQNFWSCGKNNTFIGYTPIGECS